MLVPDSNGGGPVTGDDTHKKSMKALLWVAIVAIVMLFAGLTSAYIVRQADSFWIEFDLPQMFYLSTAALLLSSATIQWALLRAKVNDYPSVKRAVGMTLLLGIVFIGFQYQGWRQLVQRGHYFVGDINNLKGTHGADYIIKYNGKPLQYYEGKFYLPGDKKMEIPVNEEMFRSFNSAGSFVYVISGLHLAHIISGIIALAVVFTRSLRHLYGAGNVLGLQLCATYWHFLDGLWVYLLLFLIFIR